MKQCQEMMTKNPECCLPDDKVYEIAQRMQSENIGSLPVVESHLSRKLMGIVTDRDLAIRVVGASRDATNTIASDVMTPDPVVCHPTDDLDATLGVMSDRQIRRIPVVDKDGQVIGIIAQADIALHLADHDKVGRMINNISQPDSVTAP